MREKELRLALVCYGGISLAVYMHGITKEIWRLLRASRAFHDGVLPEAGPDRTYHDLLAHIAETRELKLRVFSDIITGSSAGGINGVFLAQAITSGQSLEPLTKVWLQDADIERLLDPDARPLRAFSKFWATPIAWIIARKPGGTIDQTVGKDARAEVRSKLSQFVRARWFEPPFGGAVFTNMLLNAFDAMAGGAVGKPLLPDDQPLDLIVTATDFRGHKEVLRLNSPPEVHENEHRLTLTFRHDVKKGVHLASAIELAFAARATASFPGAFPPFTVGEMDGVVKARGLDWPSRDTFLADLLPKIDDKPEELVLIDGSVLANAPFRPAIQALRERPARREVDRRFVYLDPKPGQRAVALPKAGRGKPPGFFTTIFGAISDIPREQPIRDNLEAIEARTRRIRRMQHIVEAVEPDVEASIQKLFGVTFFLDRPTPARITNWRYKAHMRAGLDAGHAFSAYGHIKLSAVVEDLVHTARRLNKAALEGAKFDAFRSGIWAHLRATGAHIIAGTAKKDGSASGAFFLRHDVRYRIRRLRLLARRATVMLDRDPGLSETLLPVRDAVFQALAPYLEAESTSFLEGISVADPAEFLAETAKRRRLEQLDEATDAALSGALAQCGKAERRELLLTYLGFPYFDMATLPMLQGEGLDEFDPVKVDRIAPNDAPSIRQGGASATLKGIEFNNFGAFFSRAYRENDYLWGRLHGAERMVDIVASTVTPPLPENAINAMKHRLFLAILEEEEPNLKQIPSLFGDIRREIASGPLAKLAAPG